MPENDYDKDVNIILILISQFLSVLIGQAPAHSLFLTMNGKCVACHANPMGSGVLNDRGRRLNATYLASRDFYDEEIKNKTIESHAGFWFTKAFLPGVRPDVSATMAHTETAIGEGRNKKRTHIEKVDSTVTLLPYLDERLVISTTLRYRPDNHLTHSRYNSKYDNWDLPQHYLVWKMAEQHRMLVGMSDKFFGNQLSDLTSFTRIFNQNQSNDQVHQASYFYHNEFSTLSVQAHMGDLFQEPKYREKGLVARGEWRLNDRVWSGVSAAYSKSDARKRLYAGPHFRFGKEDRALLGEATLNYLDPQGAADNEMALVGSSMGMLQLEQGLWALSQMEFYRNDLFSRSNEGWRMGPGLWWSPIHRLKFESFIRAGRVITVGRTREEDLSVWLRLNASL